MSTGHQIDVHDALGEWEVQIAASRRGEGRAEKRLTALVGWNGDEAYGRYVARSGDTVLYRGANLRRAVAAYNEAP